jgi:hypothetical protein
VKTRRPRWEGDEKVFGGSAELTEGGNTPSDIRMGERSETTVGAAGVAPCRG